MKTLYEVQIDDIKPYQNYTMITLPPEGIIVHTGTLEEIYDYLIKKYNHYLDDFDPTLNMIEVIKLLLFCIDEDGGDEIIFYL